MVSVGCGIDVHQSQITASIRKSDDEVETRQFEACTSSLTSLREWCKSEGRYACCHGKYGCLPETRIQYP